MSSSFLKKPRSATAAGEARMAHLSAAGHPSTSERHLVMTEMSRMALFKATGAVGAAMSPAGAELETADAKAPAAVTPAAMHVICAAAPSTTHVSLRSVRPSSTLASPPSVKLIC